VLLRSGSRAFLSDCSGIILSNNTPLFFFVFLTSGPRQAPPQRSFFRNLFIVPFFPPLFSLPFNPAWCPVSRSNLVQIPYFPSLFKLPPLRLWAYSPLCIEILFFVFSPRFLSDGEKLSRKKERFSLALFSSAVFSSYFRLAFHLLDLPGLLFICSIVNERSIRVFLLPSVSSISSSFLAGRDVWIPSTLKFASPSLTLVEWQSSRSFAF